MARELAERTGLGSSNIVVHAYVDVTDRGENLVRQLGLATVPTHVLVDSVGRIQSVLARRQFPNERTIQELTGEGGGVATCCVAVP